MDHVCIIAEAGVNHNGCIERAKELIDAAAEAGADYVKFQTFTAEKHASRSALKAAYQKATTGTNDSSQYQMLQKLELSEADHHILKYYCNEKAVRFLSSPFDPDSVDFLANLGVDFIKIPSGELTNLPYLRRAGKHNLPLILSSGMADLGEIESAIEALICSGQRREKISILHCNTEYPTPFQDVNLKAIQSLKAAFNLPVGYSDHTMGIEVPIAAVAMGATIIEKHFTLDRNLPGPDHKASLEPNELKAMVAAIRNVENAIGDGRKTPSPSERKNITAARKSLHLANDAKQGDKVTDKHLIALRPGDGISPMLIDSVIGQRLKKDLEQGHKLEWADLG